MKTTLVTFGAIAIVTFGACTGDDSTTSTSTTTTASVTSTSTTSSTASTTASTTANTTSPQTAATEPPTTLRPAHLELVDAVVGGDPTAPSVELTVRNTGDEVATITRLVFTIESLLVPIAAIRPPGSSDTYDVEFPVAADLPAIVAVDVTRRVEPGDEGDTFSVSIGVPPGDTAPHRYRFRVAVVYDEADLVAARDDLLTVVVNGRQEASAPGTTGAPEDIDDEGVFTT
jgi:hypothetical protein